MRALILVAGAALAVAACSANEEANNTAVEDLNATTDLNATDMNAMDMNAMDANMSMDAANSAADANNAADAANNAADAATNNAM